MGYEFELGGDKVRVTPAYGPDGFDLLIGDARVPATLSSGDEDGEFFLLRDGQRERLFIASHGDEHFIHYRGRAFRIAAPNALEAAQREAAASSGVEEIRAPMPGVVVEIAVSAGEDVESGDLLMTLESMKLETAIHAPHPARVAEVYVAAGTTFDQGASLLRLESGSDETADETEESAPKEKSPS